MHRVMSCDMSMGLCQMYVCWKCMYVTQNVCMLEMFVCWKCTYVGSVCMLEVYVCWKCTYVGSVCMLEVYVCCRKCICRESVCYRESNTRSYRIVAQNIRMFQRIKHMILSHCWRCRIPRSIALLQRNIPRSIVLLERI